MRKQRFNRRASATLLWAAASYAVLHGGLFFVAEYRLIEFRQVPALRKTTEPERPFTILVVGNSRTANGLQAAVLGRQLTQGQGHSVRVLNYGIFGAGPLTQLICLRHLLSGGVQPDLVVVESAPTFLTDRGAAPLESVLLPMDLLFRGELGLLRGYGFDEHEVEKRSRQTLLSPWYAYRHMIFNWAAPSWVPMGKDAWWPRARNLDWRPWLTVLDTPERKQRALHQAHSEHRQNLQTFRMSQSARQALREVLATCREKKIATALLLMPEGSTFRSWYPAETTREIYDLMNALSREFDAPLIDAREWAPDDGFADSHHLLASGAAIFTERLGREVLTPLLAKLSKRPSHPLRRVLAANE